MFVTLNKTATRALLLLSVAALTACASKVRLDDLPAVVERSTSSAVIAGTDSVPRSGTNDATTNGTAIKTVQAGSAGDTNNTSDMAGLLAKRSVYFDYDSFEIRDEFKNILQAHAKNVGTKRVVKVTLEGHTDERGGAEYNLALGQKRANAVLQTLQTLGVNAAQMEAVSFGKEKPKSMGANEAGFAENRRVDIQYQ